MRFPDLTELTSAATMAVSMNIEAANESANAYGALPGFRRNSDDDGRYRQRSLRRWVRDAGAVFPFTFRRKGKTMNTGAIVALSILGIIIGGLWFSTYMLEEIRKDREREDGLECR